MWIKIHYLFLFSLQVSLVVLISFPIPFIQAEADASSTSHVSISMGKTQVSYANEHIPGQSPKSEITLSSPKPISPPKKDSSSSSKSSPSSLKHFPPQSPKHYSLLSSPHMTQHYSPSTPELYSPSSPKHFTPLIPKSYPPPPPKRPSSEHFHSFYHSSPAPAHLPVYASTPRPFYHHPSTFGPQYFPSSPSPKYYPAPSPKYATTHKIHLPGSDEREKKFPVPKEIEIAIEELNMSSEKESEKKGDRKEKKVMVEEEEQTMENEKMMKMDEEDMMEIEMSEEKGKMSKEGKSTEPDTKSGEKIYHPSLVQEMSYEKEGKGKPLYIPKRTYSPHPVRPIVTPHGKVNSPPKTFRSHFKPFHQPQKEAYDPTETPKCIGDSEKYYCDSDEHYPEYEIGNAAHKHVHKLLELYADIAGLNTELSVDIPEKKADEGESYLCHSDISYSQIYRAKNTKGKWRIIVNDISINYQMLTQTVRLEECILNNESCPLVPRCLESKCLQRFVYHRFLVYDPYDLYFPFAIETFKLPASCACHISDYQIDH